MTEHGSAQAGVKTPRGQAKAGAKPPAEAPRQSRVRAVSEILPAIGGAAFRRFGFVQSAVVSRWPEIVGQRYAGVCTPASIRFPAGERVNRFFGYPAVARVQIRQGAAQPREKPKPKAPPSLKPVDFGDGLRTIADPELRAVLESLAHGLSFTTGAPRLPETSE